MAFDGFITKAIITELNNEIIGAKVNKINQPNKNEIYLNLYNEGKNYTLNISTNPEFCRICLTNFSKSNPQNAYNFCMLLRKYLNNSKIIEVSNYDLERTIEIKFECYNELNDLVIRKLFIEIMSSQSNIILTNENNIIIDTLKHFDNNRELLPAHTYVFTPINKRSFISINTFEEYQEIVQNTTEASLSKKLTSLFIGFSRPLIKEMLLNLNINENEYSLEDLRETYEYLKNLTNSFGTNKITCKIINSHDYTLILNNRSIDNETLYPSHPINKFIDEFYNDKEQYNNFINSRNNLLKFVSNSLKKVYKKLENINLKLKECDEKDKFRLYGEILTANLYKIDSSKNKTEIILDNYYDNYKPIKIPLDNKISIQKNIEKYFKKYNKLKNALSIVSEQKNEAEKELDYIESIIFNLSNAKSMNDLNEVYEEISENITIKKEVSQKNQHTLKKAKKPSNSLTIEFTIIDGYTIYIGKNNLQNDYLSQRFACPNDIWFHTQKIHGSHILVKNPDNLEIDDIPENVLFNAAKIAKENSKASNSLNVSVDYCFAKFVKKAPGGKPGMVNYTNFKTIIVK